MWEPPARFGRVAFAVLASVAAFSTIASAAPTAPAQPRLPAAVWGVEPAARSLGSLDAAALRALKRRGVNTVVVDARSLSAKDARQVRRAAAAAGVRLLVASRPGRTPSASCAATRRLGSAACAVHAPLLARTLSLSRARGVEVVVVHLAGAGQLLDVKLPSRGRLLGVVAVPRQVRADVWRRALARVRKEPRLDLALSGRASSAQGLQVLSLIGERTVLADEPPAAAPSAPTGLAQAATTTSSVDVSWQANGTAGAQYGVYRDGQLVGTTASTTWRFTGLTCAATFEASVDAVDASGARSGRATLTVRAAPCSGGGGGGGGSSADVTPPSTPGGFARSSSTATSISVRWTASTDAVGVAGYGLYVGSLRVATTSLTTYVFGGLPCGSTQTLGVDAVDAAGNRSARATISAATSACAPGGDTTAPSAPGGLAISAAGETTLAIAWNASTDNVAVTGYGIYRNSVLVGSGTARTYSFTGLACGTSYTLGVDAYDAAGNRSTRTSVSGATTACPAPPPGSGTANLYVAAGASTSTACTVTAPCGSFDRAYKLAQPGWVVEVAGGSYGTQSIGKDASKTSAADVLFRPAPGASVTLGYLDISGSHLEVRDMTATGGADVDSSPIDTRDVTLRNITARSLFLRADNVNVIGGSIGGFNGCDAGMPEDGIKFWSDNSRGADGIVMDGVLVHDIRRIGCDRHTDCIQIYSGTNHVIKNSKLVNCPTTGLIARPASSSQPLANITIENNYFGSVLDGSEAINIGTAPDRCSGMVIRYNTVVNESSSFDCVTSAGDPGSLVEGNIISVGCESDAIWRYNVFRPGSATCGTGAVQCSPAYVNSSALDFRLASSDTCARGRGNPTSHPTTDAEGQGRPQGTVDAGADEIG